MKDGVDLVAEEGVKPTIIMQPLSYLHGVVQFTGPMTGSLTGFNISRGTGTTGTMGSLILVDGTNGLVTANITDCTMGDARGYGAGIRLVGTVDTTITDCDIYRSAGGGLRLGIGTSPFGALMDRIESGSSITIKGTTVGGAGLGLNTSGIRLMGSGSNIQVRIGGNGVDEGNMISHSSYGGIVLSGIDQVSIENNDVSNNGAFAGAAGILLVDANTVSPHVKNNSIHHQASGAGINIGGASNVTIEGSNDIYANYTGIVFYVKNNTTWDTYMMDKIPQTASSGTVTISGNNIFGNSYAGIAIRDGITGTVNIEDNDIYSNIRGGMRIQRKCNLNILRNTIRDNNRGGIHTGKDTVDGGGFGSTLGTAVLTIEKNKLYSNGSGGYGAGIDVRHASGTMYNNLVYNNYKGGIRFGDYITEIINNTVVGNGNAAGGGIVYDDLAGAVNDPAAGVPSAPLLIRNNISAYNVSAGIRACFTNTLGSEERDYNLVYSNNGQGETTCGWPGTINRRCANKQFGGCGHLWSPRGLDGPNNIIADPLFESIVEGSEDYHLKAGSPAENAGDDNLDMGAYGGSDPFVD